MSRPLRPDVVGPDAGVDVALAGPDVHRVAGLALDVGAQPDVRAEEDLRLGAVLAEDVLDHLDRVGGGAAVVGLRLDLGRGVDVHDDDRVGAVARLPVAQLARGDRVGERAAGVEVGDQDRLLRREDRGRLGHEVDAAEGDRRGAGLGGLAREPERIAGVVGDVLHLGHLVVVGEGHAVMLAHHYQGPEVQDVADYTGDSLGLSRKAAESGASTIAFCGVHFMAETASILSPEKTVLIPDLDAGCSLADSITAGELRNWKARHSPDAVVVMYVNTSAEVKAETDYCCTSSNAVKVVEHILREHGPETEILFGPDIWLGSYVERETGHSMHVWPGECHVHAGIRPDDIRAQRAAHPEAEFLLS